MIVYDSQIDISQQICATSSQKFTERYLKSMGDQRKKYIIKKTYFAR